MCLSFHHRIIYSKNFVCFELALRRLNQDIHDTSQQYCIKNVSTQAEFETAAKHWHPRAAAILVIAQALEAKIFRPGKIHNEYRAVTMPFLDRFIMNLLGCYSVYLALNPSSNQNRAFQDLLTSLKKYINKVHYEVCKERQGEIRELENGGELTTMTIDVMG